MKVPDSPAAAAVTFAVAAIAGEKYVFRTCPFTSVVSTTVASEPPPAVTAHDTGIFGSGEPSEFLISATSGAEARLPTRTVCESPATLATVAGTDGASLLSPQATVVATAPTKNASGSALRFFI